MGVLAGDITGGGDDVAGVEHVVGDELGCVLQIVDGPMKDNLLHQFSQLGNGKSHVFLHHPVGDDADLSGCDILDDILHIFCRGDLFPFKYFIDCVFHDSLDFVDEVRISCGSQ